ncbi:secreted protein, putative [Histoplasma capsulatum]|uniref:Secreted protein, putative n=1 Tax=Ajellomyces capsulatus TaxID=5037 RepID=A0A8A1MIY1_AJECA|nr:predicted protein [Histoplasma mississippiense (nom. inval.)]EDN05007.1 predicted protein [Histoplasma mississippiense (nom. inval.)]QSS66558.1 secreted protein, putative [Histoplasma capsulatum]
MKCLSVLPLFSLACAAVLPNPFPRAEDISPADVKLRGVAYGGSGCNQGTLSIELDDNGTKCPIRTRDLYASSGPGSSPRDQRRFCQLNFDLVYPRGWSFSVFGADYKGSVSLAGESTASFKTTYYFSGETNQATSSVGFKGPTSEKFEKHDVVVWDTWSPCGSTQAMLNVKQEVIVHGAGKLASTSMDGEFGHTVFFKWRRC